MRSVPALLAFLLLAGPAAALERQVEPPPHSSPDLDAAFAALVGPSCALDRQVSSSCGPMPDGAAFSDFHAILQLADHTELRRVPKHGPARPAPRPALLVFQPLSGPLRRFHGPRRVAERFAQAQDLGASLAGRLGDARAALVREAGEQVSLAGEEAAGRYARLVEGVTLYNQLLDLVFRHGLRHAGVERPLLGGASGDEDPEAQLRAHLAEVPGWEPNPFGLGLLPFPPPPAGAAGAPGSDQPRRVQELQTYLRRVAYWLFELTCNSTENVRYDLEMNHFTRTRHYQTSEDLSGSELQWSGLADEGTVAYFKEMAATELRFALRYRAAQNAFEAYALALGAPLQAPELALPPANDQGKESGFKFTTWAENVAWLQVIEIQYSVRNPKRDFYVLATYPDFLERHGFDAGSLGRGSGSGGAAPSFEGLVP